MSIVIEDGRIVEFWVIAAGHWNQKLLQGFGVHFLDSRNGFLQVLLASNAPTSLLVFLLVISKVVMGSKIDSSLIVYTPYKSFMIAAGSFVTIVKSDVLVRVLVFVESNNPDIGI